MTGTSDYRDFPGKALANLRVAGGWFFRYGFWFFSPHPGEFGEPVVR
jgi:hypothetical protein